MLLVVFGIILFVGLIVYLVYIGIKAEEPEETRPTIHASGIYSVVRRSPRASIQSVKPSAAEIRGYLQTVQADSAGNPLTGEKKENLVQLWEKNLEKNIQVVETGDKDGLELYFFQCAKSCSQNEYLGDGTKFVTREEIFQHPEIIPPFHLGCQCTLVADRELKTGENRETEAKPLFESPNFKSFNWKKIELE